MDITVVVPTYNRAPLLDRTLSSLGHQTLAAEAYEVVVGDDGSTDDTADVVARHARHYRVDRLWQEDLGFRAARARNIAAERGTGRILVFVDSGVVAPPEFLAAHLAAHGAPEEPDKVVLGYQFGYDKHNPENLITAAEIDEDPGVLAARLRAEKRCLDMREPNFQQVDDDLGGLAAPWIHFWTANVSVPAAAFHAVGRFDETFVGWGGEDIDLGYRLRRAGLPFVLSRDAAAIELPHPRNRERDVKTHQRNFERIIRRYGDPLLELNGVVRARVLHDRLAELTDALAARRAAGLDHDDGEPFPDGRVLLVGADTATGRQVERCVEPDPVVAGRVEAAGTPVTVGWGMRTGLDPGQVDRCLLADSLGRHYPAWAVEHLVEHTRSIAGEVLWWPSGRPAVPHTADVEASGC
ncbi:glycosyltransferase [Amycolatopsis sp. cmx-4-68]|uniref:glycosyltransferase n=1 Tax=Amycolatopsis sp. cmx-4-68 TaxID=2790938 RepID=UPI0039797BD8